MNQFFCVDQSSSLFSSTCSLFLLVSFYFLSWLFVPSVCSSLPRSRLASKSLSERLFLCNSVKFFRLLLFSLPCSLSLFLRRLLTRLVCFVLMWLHSLARCTDPESLQDRYMNGYYCANQSCSAHNTRPIPPLLPVWELQGEEENEDEEEEENARERERNKEQQDNKDASKEDDDDNQMVMMVRDLLLPPSPPPPHHHQNLPPLPHLLMPRTNKKRLCLTKNKTTKRYLNKRRSYQLIVLVVGKNMLGFIFSVQSSSSPHCSMKVRMRELTGLVMSSR